MVFWRPCAFVDSRIERKEANERTHLLTLYWKWPDRMNYSIFKIEFSASGIKAGGLTDWLTVCYRCAPGSFQDKLSSSQSWVDENDKHEEKKLLSLSLILLRLHFCTIFQVELQINCERIRRNKIIRPHKIHGKDRICVGGRKERASRYYMKHLEKRSSFLLRACVYIPYAKKEMPGHVAGIRTYMPFLRVYYHEIEKWERIISALLFVLSFKLRLYFLRQKKVHGEIIFSFQEKKIDGKPGIDLQFFDI